MTTPNPDISFHQRLEYLERMFDSLKDSQKKNWFKRVFRRWKPPQIPKPIVIVPQPEITPPNIIIHRPKGTTHDQLDCLKTGGFENPQLWEETMKNAFIQAKTDEKLSTLLRDCFLQEDREEAFDLFRKSKILESVREFIERFGCTKQSKIVDLGCGPGHLTYGLQSSGYENLATMDPNDQWFTGTGFLESKIGDKVRVIKSLNEWCTIRGEFDAIVSQATVHHWKQIPQVALDARRTVKPGAYWFAFSEYYSYSPRHFVDLINKHPTASRFGVYEWAYPASAYVDLIQSVGWLLVSVIPFFYKSNGMLPFTLPLPEGFDQKAHDDEVDRGLCTSGGTVESFWKEVDHFRRNDYGNRLYTQPQVLVFQRVEPY